MPTTYVLIALLPFHGGPYQSNSRLPLTAEFNTLEACNAAATWLHDRDQSTLAYCGSKG